MYDIVYSEKAEEDLAKSRRSEPAAFKKAVKLLNELVYHPRTRKKRDTALIDVPRSLQNPHLDDKSSPRLSA